MTHQSADTIRPAVSVVVPVLNEEKHIGQLLESLRRQIPPANGFEVLVADGGSTDRTREIIQGSARGLNLTLLSNRNKLSSAGRNVGARASRGRYILFLDGHCELPRDDYLVLVESLFETTGADCLCRPQPLVGFDPEGWSKAITAARHSPLGHYPGSDIYRSAAGFTNPLSAGAAYKAELVNELGGYDEQFDACEDVEFNVRVSKAGCRSYRHPDLAVSYRPRTSLRGLFRQMERYGLGRARLMARHPAVIPWPLLTATAFLMVGGFTCVWSSRWFAAWCLVSGLLFLLLVVESIRIGGGRLGPARVFAVFLTIHTGLLLGAWKGACGILWHGIRVRVLNDTHEISPQDSDL